MVRRGVPQSRRSALKTLGAAAASMAFAGCSGDGGGGTDTGSNSGDGGSEGDPTGTSVGDDGGDDTISLTWATWFPEPARMNQATAVRFIERVEERTGGRVQFDFRPGGQLGGAGEMLNLAMTQAVDIANTPPSYYSDRFALTQVAQLPGLWEEHRTGVQAGFELLVPHMGDTTVYEQEWEPIGMRPLLPTVSLTYELGLADVRAVSLDDVQGLNIRSSGGVSDQVVEAIGANPVALEHMSSYQAIERGTVDGSSNAIGAFSTSNTYELFSYMTTNAPLNPFPIMESINLESWNSLPEDVKTVFREESNKIPLHVNEIMTEFTENAIQTWEEDYGVEAYDLPDEELENWNEAVQTGVVEPWASDSDSEMRTQVLETYREVIDKYSE